MRVIKGSVKNMIIEEEPTPTTCTIATVDYTDGYSIFDAGTMPDEIPGKGKALCDMACHNFEWIDLPSHYLERKTATSFKITYANVIKGEIEQGTVAYVIPVEWIFRNDLVPGSSLLRRVQSGEISPKKIGFDYMPEEWDVLPEPVYDFTTKFERFDRPLERSDLV